MKKLFALAAIIVLLVMPGMVMAEVSVADENALLKSQNITLQKENTRLNEENERLNRENTALSPTPTQKEVRQLQKERHNEVINAMEFNKTGKAMENDK